MILTFDAAIVRKLIAASEAATERRATFADLVDPSKWRKDMDASRRARFDEEIADGGFPSGISQDDLDPEMISAGLQLVGDQGVYLMSNAPSADAIAAAGTHVAYARESDPTTMSTDEWHDAKLEIFGGDDGVEFLPAEAVRAGLVDGVDVFKIDLTPESVAAVIPEVPAAPEP